MLKGRARSATSRRPSPPLKNVIIMTSTKCVVVLVVSVEDKGPEEDVFTAATCRPPPPLNKLRLLRAGRPPSVLRVGSVGPPAAVVGAVFFWVPVRTKISNFSLCISSCLISSIRSWSVTCRRIVHCRPQDQAGGGRCCMSRHHQPAHC